MAFNVTFYNFSKKSNSTAVPASGGTTYSCTLKDGCSIINPVIKLNLGPTSVNPVSFNYCRIQDFNRYYFVNDWTSDKGMWYGNLSVDVLASFKSAIGSASELILRSSDEYDGRVTDTFYPTMNEQAFYSRDGSASFWWSDQYAGTFVLGLLSYVGSGSVQGGVNYVSMNGTEFGEFMDRVFSYSQIDYNDRAATDSATEAISNIFVISETQARSLAYLAENPYTDYIDSITWIPGTIPYASSTTGLYLGSNWLNAQTYGAFDIKKAVDKTWSTNNIPKHPQAASRGDYLNLSPYSNYQLVLPRQGVVPIDPVSIGDYDTLTVDLHIDPITGQGLYQIYAGDGAQVKHLINQCYVPIGVTVKIGRNKPVGTSLNMALEAAGMVTNIAKDLITGQGFNPQNLSGVASIMREMKAPGSGTIGDSGGYCGLFPGYPVLQSQHLYVTDEDNDHNGRPLMKVRQISDVPGYVQCAHGDISVACTDTERSEIKRHLETGFFYE